jgi:hypothetical protein
MAAGAIVMIVGLGIVLFRALEVPRYWIPFFVGAALFVAGLIAWLTSRERA